MGEPRSGERGEREGGVKRRGERSQTMRGKRRGRNPTPKTIHSRETLCLDPPHKPRGHRGLPLVMQAAPLIGQVSPPTSPCHSHSRPTPAHAANSLLLSLGTVAEEEERCGQEEHATQDHDEGAEHEGVAQAQKLPERGVLGALADQVRDLGGGGSQWMSGWGLLPKPPRTTHPCPSSPWYSQSQ